MFLPIDSTNCNASTSGTNIKRMSTENSTCDTKEGLILTKEYIKNRCYEKEEIRNDMRLIRVYLWNISSANATHLLEPPSRTSNK